MKQIKYGVGMLMGKKLSEMNLEELWQLFPIFLTEHQDCCGKNLSITGKVILRQKRNLSVSIPTKRN